MLTFIHNNFVRIENGALHVDRKFHTGMLNYAGAISTPIVAANPLAPPGQAIMDEISIPLDQLPYKVLGLTITPSGQPDMKSHDELGAQVRRSTLVVGCDYGYDVPKIARQHGVRFIMYMEYDLATQLVMSWSFSRSRLTAPWSALRCLFSYLFSTKPAMRHAYSVHCNGYPIFNATAGINSRRLLYLDSRMSHSMVIDSGDLEARLASFGSRPLRLFYSGRYEKVKGALDAVQAAVLCFKAGLPVEMDCYGMGSLAEEMRSAAAQTGGAVRIHDAIAFPEVVTRSKEADLFVCCHIQSDPSCTYLEALGSGLPVVGYSNRMWSELAVHSNAGVVTRENSPRSMAEAVSELLRHKESVATMSRNARAFALEHCFEREFSRRTDAINAAL